MDDNFDQATQLSQDDLSLPTVADKEDVANRADRPPQGGSSRRVPSQLIDDELYALPDKTWAQHFHTIGVDKYGIGPLLIDQACQSAAENVKELVNNIFDLNDVDSQIVEAASAEAEENEWTEYEDFMVGEYVGYLKEENFQGPLDEKVQEEFIQGLTSNYDVFMKALERRWLRMLKGVTARCLRAKFEEKKYRNEADRWKEAYEAMAEEHDRLKEENASKSRIVKEMESSRAEVTSERDALEQEFQTLKHSSANSEQEWNRLKQENFSLSNLVKEMELHSDKICNTVMEYRVEVDEWRQSSDDLQKASRRLESALKAIIQNVQGRLTKAQSERDELRQQVDKWTHSHANCEWERDDLLAQLYESEYQHGRTVNERDMLLAEVQQLRERLQATTATQQNAVEHRETTLVDSAPRDEGPSRDGTALSDGMRPQCKANCAEKADQLRRSEEQVERWKQKYNDAVSTSEASVKQSRESVQRLMHRQNEQLDLVGQQPASEAESPVGQTEPSTPEDSTPALPPLVFGSQHVSQLQWASEFQQSSLQQAPKHHQDLEHQPQSRQQKDSEHQPVSGHSILYRKGAERSLDPQKYAALVAELKAPTEREYILSGVALSRMFGKESIDRNGRLLRRGDFGLVTEEMLLESQVPKSRIDRVLSWSDRNKRATRQRRTQRKEFRSAIISQKRGTRVM